MQCTSVVTWDRAFGQLCLLHSKTSLSATWDPQTKFIQWLDPFIQIACSKQQEIARLMRGKEDETQESSKEECQQGSDKASKGARDRREMGDRNMSTIQHFHKFTGQSHQLVIINSCSCQDLLQPKIHPTVGTRQPSCAPGTMTHSSVQSALWSHPQSCYQF